MTGNGDGFLHSLCSLQLMPNLCFMVPFYNDNDNNTNEHYISLSLSFSFMEAAYLLVEVFNEDVRAIDKNSKTIMYYIFAKYTTSHTEHEEAKIECARILLELGASLVWQQWN